MHDMPALSSTHRREETLKSRRPASHRAQRISGLQSGGLFFLNKELITCRCSASLRSLKWKKYTLTWNVFLGITECVENYSKQQCRLESEDDARHWRKIERSAHEEGMSGEEKKRTAFRSKRVDEMTLTGWPFRVGWEIWKYVRGGGWIKHECVK